MKLELTPEGIVCRETGFSRCVEGERERELYAMQIRRYSKNLICYLGYSFKLTMLEVHGKNAPMLLE